MLFFLFFSFKAMKPVNVVDRINLEVVKQVNFFLVCWYIEKSQLSRLSANWLVIIIYFFKQSSASGHYLPKWLYQKIVAYSCMRYLLS